jgi:fimbrial chaperone protein
MARLLVLPLLLLLQAFSFSPMSQTIELDGGQKQALYLVENPTDSPMAVEISLRERIQKEDGTEDQPVTKDLAAFPPQMIVPPQEKRTVRVTFVGAKGNSEKAYRVVAEQLPLEVDGKQRKGTGIKMLLKYVAALYVDPGETSPKVVVEKIEAAKQLLLTVHNQGSQHAPLTSAKLTLIAKNRTVVLSGDQLKGLNGENVLAGTKRVFKVELPEGVVGPFKGSLKFE